MKSQETINESVLGSISFAEVAPSVSKGKPSGSVRTNGSLVFNESANEVVGVTSDKNIFKVGHDGSGKIYLVPAQAGEANTVKATKNGTSFMFKQVDVFAGIGVKPKNKYSVSAEKDGETDYFVLTPSVKGEAGAETAE